MPNSRRRREGAIRERVCKSTWRRCSMIHPNPTLPSLGNPSHNMGNPSHNMGNPSNNMGNPSHDMGNPSHNMCNPSHNTGTPSQTPIPIRLPLLGDNPTRIEEEDADEDVVATNERVLCEDHLWGNVWG
jgi:hypothetical protein